MYGLKTTEALLLTVAYCKVYCMKNVSQFCLLSITKGKQLLSNLQQCYQRRQDKSFFFFFPQDQRINGDVKKGELKSTFQLWTGECKQITSLA